MNKFIFLFVFLFLSVSVIAETVYKKTNPDGSVSFSDQATEDSKEVKIRKPTTFSPPSLPALNLPRKKLTPAAFNYEITILQPANDAVIVGQINVSVSVSIKPAINIGRGHQTRFELADQSIVSRSTSATFKNVSRGTHTLKVSVVDQNGDVISPIVSSVFHMKRFFKKPQVVKPNP